MHSLSLPFFSTSFKFPQLLLPAAQMRRGWLPALPLCPRQLTADVGCWENSQLRSPARLASLKAEETADKGRLVWHSSLARRLPPSNGLFFVPRTAPQRSTTDRCCLWHTCRRGVRLSPPHASPPLSSVRVRTLWRADVHGTRSHGEPGGAGSTGISIGLKKARGNNVDKIIFNCPCSWWAALFKQPAIKVVFKAQHRGSSRCKRIHVSCTQENRQSQPSCPVSHQA